MDELVNLIKKNVGLMYCWLFVFFLILFLFLKNYGYLLKYVNLLYWIYSEEFDK